MKMLFSNPDVINKAKIKTEAVISKLPISEK